MNNRHHAWKVLSLMLLLVITTALCACTQGSDNSPPQTPDILPASATSAPLNDEQQTPDIIPVPTTSAPLTDEQQALLAPSEIYEPSDAPNPGPSKSFTYEVHASIHENLPEYRFVATGIAWGDPTGPDDWGEADVTGLNVYNENGAPILSMDFSRDDIDVDGNNVYVYGNPIFRQMVDTMGLHVVDVNFDGYKDIIILNCFAGAHSNTWYDCWLWDSKTSSFAYSESFADICNPSINLEKQCIYSTGGSSAFDQTWDIYKFINGEFIVFNSLEYSSGDDINYQFTEKQFINSTMETVRNKTIKADGFDAALNASGYVNDDLWQLKNPRWYMCGGHYADKWLDGTPDK